MFFRKEFRSSAENIFFDTTCIYKSSNLEIILWIIKKSKELLFGSRSSLNQIKLLGYLISFIRLTHTGQCIKLVV